MTLENLVTKYIQGAECVFEKIGQAPDFKQLNVDGVKKVFESAKRYLEDAKYYQKKGNLETSLTSIAYSEGLLDALRLLGAVEFSW
jgi:FAD synthetase